MPKPENLKEKLAQPVTERMTLPIQIFDTDCFGVMWHGSYTKWLEMARVQLMEKMGIPVTGPEDKEGYIYPVVEQNFKFKASARYGDTLALTTTAQLNGIRVVFDQVFTQPDGSIVLESQTTCTVVDADWKLVRRLG